ncbi:MAG: methionyl-tRNA formyltransferase [Acidobacteriota bacterium]
MRVVFLGTPEFAVPSLEALLNVPQQCKVVGVMTQPDRPAGRGQRLTAPPVKLLADRHDVPVFQADRLRGNLEALEFLRSREPDLNVVVAFGQILTSEFFDYPSLGTLNVHASLLPKYRGAAPVIHALINGETLSGVTIMKIDEGMDTGDILSQLTVPVTEDMPAGALAQVLASSGADLLIETIPGYAKGEIQLRPQEHAQSTYAPRIKKEESRINWKQPAATVHNLVRALNPWPTAFTEFRGEKLRIWRTKKRSQVMSRSSSRSQPGQLLTVEKGEIAVQCGDSTSLCLIELQLPNRRRVSAGDFVNGVRLKVGEVLE